MKRVEILTIGDELLDGRLVDSNSATLSAGLLELGLPVFRHVSVRDDRTEMIAALREAARRSDVVLVSGGLGPTSDDLTADAAAAAFDLAIERRPEALDHVRRFFAERGREMSPSNEKQADLPAGCRILPNPWGTAVGFALHVQGCRLYFMPGVPSELEGIFNATVLPDIAGHIQGSPQRVATLKIFGIGESEVADVLEGRGGALPGASSLVVQYRATFPEIHVRLVLRDPDAPDDLLDDAAAEARRRLGDTVFAAGRDASSTRYADVVIDHLAQRRLSLAVAESSSGGHLISWLQDAAGSVALLHGGVVAATADARHRLLGLPFPPRSSDETAATMAEQIRVLTGADVGLSLHPLSADDGSTLLHVAVATTDGSTLHHRRVLFDPPRLTVLACYAAGRALVKTIE